MATVRVRVTAADILAGQRENAMACPVALAVNRSVNRSLEISNAMVSSVNVRIPRHLRPTATSGLPTDVVQRVKDFDAGLPMEPFEFDLEAPAQ